MKLYLSPSCCGFQITKKRGFICQIGGQMDEIWSFSLAPKLRALFQVHPSTSFMSLASRGHQLISAPSIFPITRPPLSGHPNR